MGLCDSFIFTLLHPFLSFAGGDWIMVVGNHIQA